MKEKEWIEGDEKTDNEMLEFLNSIESEEEIIKEISFWKAVIDRSRPGTGVINPNKIRYQYSPKWILFFSTYQLHIFTKICKALDLKFYFCLQNPRADYPYLYIRINAPTDIVRRIIDDIKRMEENLNKTFGYIREDCTDNSFPLTCFYPRLIGITKQEKEQQGKKEEELYSAITDYAKNEYNSNT